MTTTPLRRLQPPAEAPGPAGPVHQRLHRLVQRYVTAAHLRDRLEDLPGQFIRPQPRPWPRLPWSSIHPDQLQGLTADTCCQILAGAINTEAPIRDYTQASRQYLAPFHPQMAQFVGGVVTPAGQVLRPGLWELEEKRHTPALMKLYGQLGGQPWGPQPHRARPFTPSGNPRADLYRHGLHRIATEYGATCLYLWLMAYATGPLQTVLEQLVIDEINHLVKFWGFGRWAYPEACLGKTLAVLARALMEKATDRRIQGSLIHTLRRMMGELAWESWDNSHRLMLLYTFDQVMRVLYRWDRTLTREYLESLFGPGPMSPSSSRGSAHSQ